MRWKEPNFTIQLIRFMPVPTKKKSDQFYENTQEVYTISSKTKYCGLLFQISSGSHKREEDALRSASTSFKKIMSIFAAQFSLPSLMRASARFRASCIRIWGSCSSKRSLCFWGRVSSLLNSCGGKIVAYLDNFRKMLMGIRKNFTSLQGSKFLRVFLQFQ